MDRPPSVLGAHRAPDRHRMIWNTAITRPCLVVDAASEIGHAVAARLVVEGRPVALTHPPGSAFGNTLTPGRRPGYQVQWYAHDVRNSRAASALIDAINRDLVGIPDLVYCAGAPRDKPISLMTDNDWHDVIASNLTGAFFMARALAARYTRVSDGRLIFVGSIAATKAAAEQANYAAAAGGLEALSRQLAVELGPCGATSNVVAPGFVDGRLASQMLDKSRDDLIRRTPLRELGRAADVAGAVAWLVSDAGRYVTGQTIRVDGGLSAA